MKKIKVIKMIDEKTQEIFLIIKGIRGVSGGGVTIEEAIQDLNESYRLHLDRMSGAEFQIGELATSI